MLNKLSIYNNYNKNKYKECNLWNEIKNCCENQNTNISNFIYKNMKFIIIKKNSEINFTISQINKIEIIKILNDLPDNITNLTIYLDEDIDKDPKYGLLGGIGGGLMQLVSYGTEDVYVNDYDYFNYLKNAFTNLPISLNSIKFMTKELNDIKKVSTGNYIKFNKLFNFLFSIKLPFDCKIFLGYEDNIFRVDNIEGDLVIDNNNFNFRITDKQN